MNVIKQADEKILSILEDGLKRVESGEDFQTVKREMMADLRQVKQGLEDKLKELERTDGSRS